MDHIGNVFYHLPTRDANERVSQEYSRETDFSHEDQQRITDSNLQHLTTEQAHIYHDVLKKIDNDRGGFCFLDDELAAERHF